VSVKEIIEELATIMDSIDKCSFLEEKVAEFNKTK